MMADNFPKLGKRDPHQDALTYDVLTIGQAETMKISKRKTRDPHKTMSRFLRKTRNPHKTMSRFLSKTVKQWHDIFKALITLKENNYQQSFSWQ